MSEHVASSVPSTHGKGWIHLTDTMRMFTLGNVGTMALDYLVIEPGSVLNPVTHEYTDEILYIAEGELVFVIAGERITLRAGDTIEVPRGTSHGSLNTSGRPVVMIAGNAPAFRSPTDDMTPTGETLS